MTTATITTNNVPRDIIGSWTLSADERAQFDYVDWDAVDNGEASAEFIRYRGELHDLGEFESTRGLHQMPELQAWHGYRSDSYFSGLVIRWADEHYDTVVVGRYYV